MRLSAFGEKFAGQSGIVELMDDLGVALNENPEAIFMGGGNPAHIPEADALFKRHLQTILDSPTARHSMLGIYQSPQGDLEFRTEMAAYLKRHYGWPLSAANISVCNGSQSAFFLIANLLAGHMPDGSHRRLHLPLSPEYLGYRDAGLSRDFFSATRPEIEHLDNKQFKYHVDFSQLSIDDDVAALCVSRPTNPTGNVLTDAEVQQLDAIARERNVPLLIDGAYGQPFPNILFSSAQPLWNNNVILALSLSKLGLPGARTGIIVSSEEFARALSNANTIASLACGTLGPAIGKRLLRDDAIDALSNDIIRPFYQARAEHCVTELRRLLGQTLPYHIHRPEGAFFLWLWFEGLPIPSRELYQRLKQRGVLVVPGEPFFIGVDETWRHQNECIRVSYSQEASKVQRGFEIIAKEVQQAYDTG